MSAIPPHMRAVRLVDAGACRVALGSQLTVAEAPLVSHAVGDMLSRRAHSLRLDLRRVTLVDAVGLAALLACQHQSDAIGVECSITTSRELERQLIEAKLVEQFAIVEPEPGDDGASVVAAPNGGAPRRAMVAHTSRVALRQPGIEDVPLFCEWAYDPLVDQMVGSDLLYRCRHLDPGDPALFTAIVHDPRALTVLVELQPDRDRPVGFVRLYDIDLVSGFGFLETVVAERRSARRGLGIEASRLLLAYCQDVMGIRRVEAKVYAYNLLSINGLRRNGFQQEGILREAHVYDNQAWDIFVFSILEQEMTRERERDGRQSFRLFPDVDGRS
jgi:RimJ/RimL family protein N-acetyltransferase/anti-anti-sigma regulatory factor